MRKLLVIAVAVALSLASASARAEEGSDLEISGNVTTVTGWQSQFKNVNIGTGGILADGLETVNGVLQGDDFGFYLDQVEIDLAKSFGENIRIRADLDFSPHRAPAAGGVYVEQGYVTANIPAGNGIELLVGRFNSGIGYDPIDRNELSTVSFSPGHRNLLPHNLTGARLGYDFSEATRLEFFVVNDLQDATPVGRVTSELPSFGFNLSYAWGEEGAKSWVKFSGAGGSETATKKPFSFLGDLAADVAVSEAFRVGAEGIYRQDNNPGGGDNAQFIAGQLKGTYAFSDVWDGTLRYGFEWDLDTAQGTGAPNNAVNATSAAGLTAAGTIHNITLATGYQITDGARLVVEGNIEMTRPSAGGSGFIAGVAGMFAYSF